MFAEFRGACSAPLNTPLDVRRWEHRPGQDSATDLVCGRPWLTARVQASAHRRRAASSVSTWQCRGPPSLCPPGRTEPFRRCQLETAIPPVVSTENLHSAVSAQRFFILVIFFFFFYFGTKFKKKEKITKNEKPLSRVSPVQYSPRRQSGWVLADHVEKICGKGEFWAWNDSVILQHTYYRVMAEPEFAAQSFRCTRSTVSILATEADNSFIRNGWMENVQRRRQLMHADNTNSK